MATTPYTINTFGGLNLTTDPLDVGPTAATAMNNCDVTPRGALRTRPGLTSFTTYVQSTPATNGFNRLHFAHNGDLLAGTNTLLVALSPAGGLVTSSADPPNSAEGYAPYSTPTTSYTFVTRSGGVVPQRYTGSAFAVPTYTGTQPTGQYLTVTPWDNRLVNFGLSANPSRLIFSDPGDPLSFPANNFLDLGFANGGANAARTWQGDLYMIGSGQWFRIYGTGTDQGDPIFQYTTINTPFAEAQQVGYVTGPLGVYALTTSGLWRTSGGPFTLVSDGLNPLFQGSATPSLLASASGVETAYADGRLYFAVTHSITRDVILVYDLKMSSWLYWTVNSGGLTAGRSNDAPRVYIGCRTGTSPNPIAYLDPNATTDLGAAIPWTYTSGRYQPNEGHVTATLESSVIGSGTVGMSIETDLYGSLTGPGATLGVSPATAEGWPMGDQEGLWFAHTLSGTSAASVSELTHHISFVRASGNAR